MTYQDTSLEEWEVLDLLTSLVDKSLVVYEEDEHGGGRYRLLETVRQYARDKLLESHQSESVRRRHQGYFLNWTLARGQETASLELGLKQKVWYEHFEEEHDNLRAALDWCLADTRLDDAVEEETLFRFCLGLHGFWWWRSHISEGYQYLCEALSSKPAANPTLWRARVLSCAAGLAHSLGDLEAVHVLQEEALLIAAEVGDQDTLASAYNRLGAAAFHECDFAIATSYLEQALGLDLELGRYSEASGSTAVLAAVSLRQGDFAAAKVQSEEALRLARTSGQLHNEAFAEIVCGHVAHYREQYVAACTCFNRALNLLHESGVRVWEPWALEGLGRVALSQQDEASARRYLEQAVELCRVSHQPGVEARCLIALSYVALRQQEHDQAKRLLNGALGLLQGSGMKWEIVCALEATATIDARLEQWAAATCLYGAAEAQRSRMGATASLTLWTDGANDMSSIHNALDSATFAAAWQAGEAMTLEQAVAYALRQNKVHDNKVHENRML